MKNPTQAGQAEAARRANEVSRTMRRGGGWEAEQFEDFDDDRTAFAIACEELLAKDVELGTAKAVLGQIARLLKHALSFGNYIDDSRN